MKSSVKCKGLGSGEETVVREKKRSTQMKKRGGHHGKDIRRLQSCTRSLQNKRKHLLQIGGQGLREVGANAIKAVLAHDVQVLYSIHGRKRKRAFVNLRLYVICHKAGCDQAEALDFRKRWLAGSGDRCGGRKRRFMEAFVVEQPDDSHSQSGDYRLLAAAVFLPSHSGQGLDINTATVPPQH
ncbi:hypothetical protein HPB51_014872 [Rhipicephalus microplus]|uniref:Uncharacterized protein n=1 Tax=Rhipicephalus microplus TaxID=6941 RepID=A0A9J6DGN0_RHIMP|nr:hypothetical protein HPB51_014872 [Rhipicephalus microplus]